MNSNDNKNKNVKFYGATTDLKQKVGMGGFDKKALEKANAYMEKADVDISPFAQENMKQIRLCIEQAESGEVRTASLLEQIKKPIMDIKANAGMFHFALAGNISAQVLNFLENIEYLDDDALDIVKILSRTLIFVFHNKLQGDGGPKGQVLEKELGNAIQRYWEKHNA